jgi:hypothetical protein
MVKLSKAFYSKIGKKGINMRWVKEHSKVRISKKLSPEKVAIHAYLCGDGWIAVRKDNRGYPHYEIRVFPDDNWLAKFIVRLFKKEFRIIPKIIQDHNFYRVEIQNKPACLNLLSLGSYSTYNWEIPKNLSKDLLKEWIKCFFDCESNVDITGKRIALKSVNFKGLLEIKDALNLFKITSKVYGPYKPKNEKHSEYGILLITGTNILAYKRLISFHHPAKKEKLEQF